VGVFCVRCASERTCMDVCLCVYARMCLYTRLSRWLGGILHAHTHTHTHTQVVFTGRTAAAQDHFGAMGMAPSSPDTSVADHVLDMVIKVRLPSYGDQKV